MRRKVWIKRRQPQYKLDRRETIMRWTIMVVVCVVVAFMLSGLVHAQPEMEVGQRWKCGCNICTYEGDGNFTSTLMKCGASEGVGGFRVDPDLFIEDKPAPRPEFKLSNQHVVDVELQRPFWEIADELRYLRKEIEGMRK